MRILALAFVAILLGCGGKSAATTTPEPTPTEPEPTPAEPGPTPAEPAGCLTDADCGEGMRCDECPPMPDCPECAMCGPRVCVAK